MIKVKYGNVFDDVDDDDEHNGFVVGSISFNDTS
jgi:hypothetical protein